MPNHNEKLAAAVSSLKGKRILIIGDVMLDHYVWGDVERISPEAPVPVIHVQKENELPGGAANVARNITALGGEAVLVGIIGRDTRGETLTELCEIDDIEPRFARDDRPTTTKVRFISQNQQLLRSDWENNDPASEDTSRELEGIVKQELEKCDIVVISDYAKGVMTAGLAEVLRSSSCRVVVDPKPSQYRLYKGFYLMTPNHREAASLSGREKVSYPPVEEADTIISEYCDNVLITCGANGMYLKNSEGKEKEIPSRARQVYEVSGAGDTVVAVAALALSAGLNLEESAVMANHAAGLVVGKVGTATVTPQELADDLLAHIN